MTEKNPKINVDILVVKRDKVLLSLLTKKWAYQGKQVYGVPGREIRFGEEIGQAVRRYVKWELGCQVIDYKIISINANYALGDHYLGVGVIANIKGEPKVLIPKDWVKWEWFTKNNIPDNLFPATKNLLTCYRHKKICVSE